MDDKEIDDMFFKTYGYEWLTDEYKDPARKTSAYAGLKLYIKLREFTNIVQDICKNKIK